MTKRTTIHAIPTLFAAAAVGIAWIVVLFVIDKFIR